MKEIKNDYDDIQTVTTDHIGIAKTRNRKDIDMSSISSQVLNRLIEEVRNEDALSINAYNRMHNRHNRSR